MKLAEVLFRWIGWTLIFGMILGGRPWVFPRGPDGQFLLTKEWRARIFGDHADK